MSRLSRIALPLVVGLLTFASSVPMVRADEQGKKKDSAADKVKLASILLKGDLTEAPSQPGLFGELSPNLSEMIARLDKAAGDKDISGVVLRLRNPSLGRARIAELRAAISRVRKSGKQVYAQLESGSTADYLLACACDEIVMPATGYLLLPGVRMEMSFYKGLFDKLGIEADFMHKGAYKGAAEPLTREKLSEPVRKNMTAVVDDYYQQMVEVIAADRKLEPARVKELIDNGLFMAGQAKQSGLIDRVAYEDEFRDELKKAHQADELALAKGYGKKKVDTDFSGPMGMFKLMQMMMGIPTGTVTGNSKRVALIYATGAITSGKSEVGMFGGQTMGSDTIVAALRQANLDRRVVAIVLRVNSPGGSALASDLIWREMIQIKKPIIASMGDVAASGGYYISMGADEIYAEPGTLTGSIGVVGGKLVSTGMFDKIGITTEVISRGKNSGMFTGTQKFSPTERKAMTAMMDDFYQQFTEKAAAGRKMKLPALEKLAGGQVWTGNMAKENGLVDELGTLKDAVAAAKQRGGLKPDDKVDLLILPKPKTFLDQLFSTPGSDDVSLIVPPALKIPGLTRYLRKVETLQRVFRQPAAFVMPVEVEIK